MQMLRLYSLDAAVIRSNGVNGRVVGDVDCVTFWCEFARGVQRYLVGFGETPDEAYNDLAERISRFESAFNIETNEIKELSDELWKVFIKGERPKTKLWDSI